MDYIPVYEGDEPSDGKTIKVSLDRVQRSGVRTETVEPRVLVRSVRGVGTVAIDESRQTIVTMRSDGYVEDLFVDKTGQTVQAGEPLFRVYSPDIQQALTDLHRRHRPRPGDAGAGPVSLDGTMRRLRNLGVPESRIREVREQRHQPAHDRLAGAGDRHRHQSNASSTASRSRPATNSIASSTSRNVWVIADVAEGDLADDQARHPRNRDVPGLSQPAGRRRRDVHLSGREDGNAHRSRAHRSAQSGRAAEDRHVRRRRVPRRTPALSPVTSVPTSADHRQRHAADRAGRQRRRPLRAAAGQARPPRRRLSSRSSTASRHGEEIVTTATFLIDAESNLQTALKTFTRTGAAEMIAAVIRWSARNLLLVGFAGVFLTLAGLYAVSRVPLDAIPDLSDVQVIVYTEYPGQAPQVVEDQVTYPLTTAMLSVPKSRVVRGFSFFGVSFVYVIFEDGTDLYWARSRVLEYLNSAARRLPAGVAPSLGPDATGVGWVYQYVVRGAQKNLAELRSIQDWYIRYGLAKAEGVAEVASVGGFVKQYSVVIDPRRLQSLGISLSKIRDAIAFEQYRRRRPHHRAGRNRIRRARARLYQEPRRSRTDRRQEQPGRAGPAARRGARRTGAGRAPRHHRGERRRRSGDRHRAATLRRECALRHPERQAAARRNRAQPAERRHPRRGLRPLEPDLPRHRHAQAHPDRGKHHRRASSAWCFCCMCAARWWRSSRCRSAC